MLRAIPCTGQSDPVLHPPPWDGQTDTPSSGKGGRRRVPLTTSHRDIPQGKPRGQREEISLPSLFVAASPEARCCQRALLQAGQLC